MRIRLAKKVWKRPWNYTPGMVRTAARRLGLEKLLGYLIDAWGEYFWNNHRIEPSIRSPLGIRYWFNVGQ